MGQRTIQPRTGLARMHLDSLLQVDLAAISHNTAVLMRMLSPETACCGVVKADAYGLGACRVAEALQLGGMGMLAVFRVEEALDLLSAEIGCPILVLGPVRGLSTMHPLMPGLASGQVELVLHDDNQLRDVERIAAASGVTVGVHVEFDSGMRRGGSRDSDAVTLIHGVMKSKAIRLAGVMTHFTDAGRDTASTAHEHDAFLSLMDRVGRLPRDCKLHVAATAATVRSTDYHHDLVRIGLGWAGWVPGDQAASRRLGLKPAVSWTSRVIHIHQLSAGDRVGYGGLWTAPRNTCIGLVPVGYADGLPPTAGATAGRPGARVHVAAQNGWQAEAPIVGTVSMDQIAIDLGPAGRSQGEDLTVTLIGASDDAGASLPEFASASGVSPHQLLVGIGHRVRRAYRDQPVDQPISAFAEAV